MFDYAKKKLGRTGLLIVVSSVMLLLASWLQISKTNIELVIFKFLIFCPAVVLVHFVRKQLFPYFDMRLIALNTDNPNTNVVLFGIFLFYIGMTYILVSAI